MSIIYLMILLSILIKSSYCTKNHDLLKLNISICIFLLFRWVTNYKKCTLVYFECKIRNIKKEESFAYNILTQIIDINKKSNIEIFYLLISYLIFYNFDRIIKC